MSKATLPPRRETQRELIARVFYLNAQSATACFKQAGRTPADGTQLVLNVVHELRWPNTAAGNFSFKHVERMALNLLLEWKSNGFRVPHMGQQVARHERALNGRLGARRN